jgi:hypothetical protein
MEDHAKMIKELEELENMTKEKMWLKELNELNQEYILFKEEKERIMDSNLETKKVKRSQKILNNYLNEFMHIEYNNL